MKIGCVNMSLCKKIKNVSTSIGKNITKKIAKRTREKIREAEFKKSARKKASDFTRDRKMPFEDVVIFMLTSYKCSTQSALRRFFKNIGRRITMSQQSLSEARAKINVSAFVELFKVTVEAMMEECHKTWKGYYVYAIDGSKIALPSDKKLRRHFGGLGKAGPESAPTAQASAFYDVLNDIVVDAEISPLDVDERTLAKTHIEACEGIIAGRKALIILDRGYPSFDFIETLEKGGYHYVMRVKEKFNKGIDAQAEPDGYVWLGQGAKRIQVRVVKFLLGSGETETLITNITDKRLGTKAFKQLYFRRWPIETKYDIVKNKVLVENFSSRTVEGIKQDFFAAMYLTNVAAAAAIDAQPAIEGVRKHKGNRYQYKANINEAIGILKDRLVLALSVSDTDLQAMLIQEVVDEITRSVIPIRPNRSVGRKKTPRNSNFHHNRKRNS